MYKININDNTLYLIQTDKLEKANFDKSILISPYSGKSKILLSYIDMLEKTNRFSEVVIHFHDVKQLKADFEQLFKVIKASGGVVLNTENKVLMIYRRGFWDLPKGKIDNGEKKKQAAIREVEEETGIDNITIYKKITTTRHTYRLKNGRRALKITFWYEMTAPTQKLTPQLEEDIEIAKWLSPNELIMNDAEIYSNILDVLECAKLV
ncbi:MAG: NUDIX domain-containing protein [Saprospiraceae bacterium]|nr:NUDIX domain-containing protein [Bacteroidia bacterium]NNE16396.1 NUDIX domain-containing protein [Saprospiraceae bacterium]NNL93500.1 NUDIX domain-containing protein [Saprospiraceae bacterium]